MNPIFTSVYPNLASGVAKVKSSKRSDSASAGNGGAVHSGNHRLAKAVNLVKHRRHAPRILKILALRLLCNRSKSIEVHPRAKCFSFAGDNHHTCSAFINLVERVEQLVDHLHGDRVALLRTRQSDDGDLAFVVQFQCVVGHFIFRSISSQNMSANELQFHCR